MNWKRYFRYLDRLYILWAFVVLGGVILFQERINNGMKFLLLAACAFLWLSIKGYMVFCKRRRK